MIHNPNYCIINLIYLMNLIDGYKSGYKITHKAKFAFIVIGEAHLVAHLAISLEFSGTRRTVIPI